MKWSFGGVAVALAVLCGAPVSAFSQTPTRQEIEQARAQLGGDASTSNILQKLRDSGLSRSQVRSRLQLMGYDPNLADRYFDAMEAGGGALSSAPEDQAFVEALNRMGVGAADSLATDSADGAMNDALLAADRRFRADSLFKVRMERQDSIALARAGITDLGLPLFGRSLFNRRTTQFQPLMSGPVNDSYRLGPGDEVDLILTGDVELAYQLNVNRQGFLVIPDVGQINVAGMTLGQLDDVLYNRLGQVYSGVRRDAGASTHFQVSLGELRVNQVYVVGEVELPGAYPVGGLGTAFNALYSSGGPAVTGSFRTIEVRRGGRTVSTMDVYDYLLQGETAQDIRLNDGDMVFVPLAGPHVVVTGEVRRPAVYEVEEGEGLRDVLRFAGGFRPQAVVERVQISRILPPGQRRPGVDRVVIDVPIEQLMDTREPIPMRGGDQVTVFQVSAAQKEYVELTGEVNRPGRFQWQPGLTLADVLSDAQGLDPQAYRARAHVFRLNEADSTRSLLQVSLEDVGTGQPFLLQDRDSVVVYSRAALAIQDSVRVEGLVKHPGLYPLARGMTLQDLVLTAGGYTEGAYKLTAEIARRPNPAVRTDTTAITLQVPIAGEAAAERLDAAGREVPEWRPSPEEVPLEPGDQVFIRQAPGYEPPRTVIVRGEVRFPGPYTLANRGERLASVIRRAGGLTSEAFPDGFKLTRGGHLVGTNLPHAMSERDSRDNVLLEGGDTLYVPTYDPTVLIAGAVAFETRALYVPGKGVDYYVGQAGGYLDEADRKRVSVTYPNGEREVVDRMLFWRLTPEVKPGSQITVPVEPESAGFDWGKFLSTSVAVTSAAATLIIAIDRIGN